MGVVKGAVNIFSTTQLPLLQFLDDTSCLGWGGRPLSRLDSHSPLFHTVVLYRIFNSSYAVIPNRTILSIELLRLKIA